MRQQYAGLSGFVTRHGFELFERSVRFFHRPWLARTLAPEAETRQLRRMSLRKRGPLVLLAVALGTAACASSEAGPAPGMRPSVELTPAERTRPADCSGSWVVAAVGRAIDGDGAPIEGASVGYCVHRGELGTCLAPVQTDRNGWYTMWFPDAFRCVDDAAVRLVVPATRSPRLADTYCAPPLAPRDGVLEAPDAPLVRIERPTAEVLDGGARELTFANGVVLAIVATDLVEAEGLSLLGAGTFANGTPSCAAGARFDGAFAFGPELGVRVADGAPGIRFRLPAPFVPDGAEVDLFVQGGTGTQLGRSPQSAVKEGAFVRYGQGRVVRGEVIPDPGSELPALTAVAFRRR
jgi:hypothetical protein